MPLKSNGLKFEGVNPFWPFASCTVDLNAHNEEETFFAPIHNQMLISNGRKLLNGLR